MSSDKKFSDKKLSDKKPNEKNANLKQANLKPLEPIVLFGDLDTEYRTLAAMIGIYCKHNHKLANKTENHEAKGRLCSECSALLEYAKMRLDRCPYGETKPACNKCPIHCYKPEPKEAIKKVMRFGGPRMLLNHPILSIKHIIRAQKMKGDKITSKPAPNLSNRHKRKQRELE